MANLLSPYTAFAGFFFDAILSSSGAPVTNTSVTIYQSDGATLATLYTDQTKATTTSNPVSTDSYGNLLFYTAPGEYILSLTIGGTPTTKKVFVPPWYSDGAWNVYTVTTNTTAVSGDAVLANATSAALTITLPSPVQGARVRVEKIDTSANGVTLATPSGSIFGYSIPTAGVTNILLSVEGASIELMADGTNWRRAGGNTGWDLNATLAELQYPSSTTSANDYPLSSSASLVVIDSTNLKLSFVVPPSGNFDLLASHGIFINEGSGGSYDGIVLGWLNSGSQLGPSQQPWYPNADETTEFAGAISCVWHITGQTPGTALTLDYAGAHPYTAAVQIPYAYEQGSTGSTPGPIFLKAVAA